MMLVLNIIYYTLFLAYFGLRSLEDYREKDYVGMAVWILLVVALIGFRSDYHNFVDPMEWYEYPILVFLIYGTYQLINRLFIKK